MDPLECALYAGSSPVSAEDSHEPDYDQDFSRRP
jgi:hypothetical protein